MPLLWLLLDGPLNGLYATLGVAYAKGYNAPDADTARAWDYEPVLTWEGSSNAQ
jgi:hypothetical protein